MAAVAALNVLAGLGSEVVVVIKGLPGMGEELLSVAVAGIFAAVREGVIEVEVVTGVRDLGVWMLAVARLALSGVPVVGDAGVRKVVRGAETEEESRATVVGVLPRAVVVVGGEAVAEVSLSAVVRVTQVVG